MVRHIFRHSYFLFLVMCAATPITAINANRFSPIREHIQKNFIKGWWNSYAEIGIEKRYPDFLTFLEHDDACIQFKRALHSIDTEEQSEALRIYNSVLTDLTECLNNQQNFQAKLKALNTTLCGILTISFLYYLGHSRQQLIHPIRILKAASYGNIAAWRLINAMTFGPLSIFLAWHYFFKAAADLPKQVDRGPWLQKCWKAIKWCTGYDQNIKSLEAKIQAWSQLAAGTATIPHSQN